MTRARQVLILSVIAVLSLGAHAAAGVYRWPYPPGMDQSYYLEAAQDFAARFVFQPKSPLYSAWLGAFYMASGGDLVTCYQAEKYGTLAVFLVSIGLLAATVFDIQSGILAVVWLSDLKYITLETNGSNTLSGAILALSLVALLRIQGRWRVPTALLLLYAATLAHPILRVSWGLVCAGLLLAAIVRPDRTRSWGDRRAWAGALAVGLVATMLIHLRPRNDGLELSLRKVVRFSFAVVYCDRYRLHDRFPGSWEESDQIIAEVFPGSRSLLDAVRENPGEIRAHLAWNTRQAFRCLAALLGAGSAGGGLLVLFAAYATWFAAKGRPGQPGPPRGLLLLWVAALLVLIPITISTAVFARYLIPLVPVGVLGTLAPLRAGLRAVRLGVPARPSPA